MTDKIAGDWRFHFALRLIALVVIVASVYAIFIRENDQRAQLLPPEKLEQQSEPAARITLSDLRKMEEKKQDMAAIESGSGNTTGKNEWPVNEWPVEENDITVDGVLVPQKETVISSSRDGKISDLPLENGDRFSKGDILVRYDCADLEAEAEIAGVRKEFSETKSRNIDQLFKLDIISDVDRLNAETEDKELSAKIKMYEARLNDCTIRAGFDGVVTKRLANEGEYTRTDRVLMEVVSNDPLNVEFLLPSKWLRWVNVGAPVEMLVNETGRTYMAKIVRIYGAVDPVSQSIQIRASLDPYRDVLLSGMSGKVSLDVSNIRKEGISGFLTAQNRP